MGVKRLPPKLCTTLGSKEAVVEELRRNREEPRRTQKNSRTLMRIYGGEAQGLTDAELLRRFVAFLWSRQVDAAA